MSYKLPPYPIVRWKPALKDAEKWVGQMRYNTETLKRDTLVGIVCQWVISDYTEWYLWEIHPWPYTGDKIGADGNLDTYTAGGRRVNLTSIAANHMHLPAVKERADLSSDTVHIAIVRRWSGEELNSDLEIEIVAYADTGMLKASGFCGCAVCERLISRGLKPGQLTPNGPINYLISLAKCSQFTKETFFTL